LSHCFGRMARTIETARAAHLARAPAALRLTFVCT